MIERTKSAIRAILPKNTFARGVSILAGGTASAQLLLVLAAPLLTRLYTPEDFGLFAVYVSLLALVGVIASLRYELAIPLPEDDVEAANVAVLCLLLVGFSTFLTGILVFFLGEPFAVALGVPKLVDYSWILPVGVLLGGSYQVFNYWGIRTQQFPAIAATKLRQAIVTLVVQLTAFKLGAGALLYGQAVGQGVGTTSLALPAFKTEAFRNTDAEGVRAAAKRYKRFPIFLTWDGLLNVTGTQLPPILFAALFGPAAAGLYSLASRVLSLPASLLGSAIGQVFFGSAAEAYRNNKHGQMVAQLQAKLIHIGLPPALVLFLLGPDIFAFVFGDDWRSAGQFAKWMAPWLLFAFVYSPLSTLFAVMERQREVLVLQLVLLASRVAAIALGAWLGDVLTTVMLFSGASAICYFGFLFWLARIAGNPSWTIWKDLSLALAAAVLFSMPIMLVMAVVDSGPIDLAGAVAITTFLIGLRYWQLLRSAY